VERAFARHIERAEYLGVMLSDLCKKEEENTSKCDRSVDPLDY